MHLVVCVCVNFLRLLEIRTASSVTLQAQWMTDKRKSEETLSEAPVERLILDMHAIVHRCSGLSAEMGRPKAYT